jgi:SpoVK/Ycf46/Vps4 family AAA+-type ATPase
MTTPAWQLELTQKYRANVAHAFILHNNVRDYVMPNGAPAGRLMEYLPALFSRRIVVVYDRAGGFQFPVAGHRDRFMELLNSLGLGQQTDPAIAAALGQSSGDELPTDPGAALPLLDRVLRGADGLAVIIDYADLLFPAADPAMMAAGEKTALLTAVKWGTDREIATRGNIIIMVTAELFALHPALRAASAGWHAVEVPLPGPEIRQRFVEWYLGESPIATELDAVAIANMCAGLSLVHMEDIFLSALLAGRLDAAMIKARKREIVASEYGEVLEFMDPVLGFEDIGGLEHIKTFFMKNVIRPIRENRKNRVPMGILMTGPAGTGKSIMAQAVAREAGINAVVLRVGGKIASMWQGQGERNLEKALTAIKSLAPTIVFIDEIDQVVARGGGAAGNQQDSRIFQRLLEFMSDTAHRGLIIFLAATNRPDLMDPALRRPGRFDKKIPFLVPDAAERESIFRVMLRRYLNVTDVDLRAAVDRTEGWTGAEIEAVVVTAAEVVEDDNLPVADALAAALDRITPSTADIEFMTMIAIAECNDAALLPPRYRAKLADRRALEKEIERLRPATRSRGEREL